MVGKYSGKTSEKLKQLKLEDAGPTEKQCRKRCFLCIFPNIEGFSSRQCILNHISERGIP